MKGLNILRLAMLAFGLALSAKAEQPSLRTVVTPSSIFEKDGKGFYVFESVSDNQNGDRVVRAVWTNIVRGV